MCLSCSTDILSICVKKAIYIATFVYFGISLTYLLLIAHLTMMTQISDIHVEQLIDKLACFY